MLAARESYHVGAVGSFISIFAHATVWNLTVPMNWITTVRAYRLRAEGCRCLQVCTHGTLAHVPMPALSALNLAIKSTEVPILGLNRPLRTGRHPVPVVATSRHMRRLLRCLNKKKKIVSLSINAKNYLHSKQGRAKPT